MKHNVFRLNMILLLVAAIVHPCKAQTTFSFGYDASGNRLTRTISLKSALITQDSVEIKKAQIPLDDLIGQHKIRIYPNPTKGILGVEIQNIGENTANLQIYSLGGLLLQKVRLASEYGNVDLSRQPAGIYFLKIIVGNKNAVWKIIKE